MDNSCALTAHAYQIYLLYICVSVVVAAYSQCVLTGGSIADGDCRTSDGGCCDLLPECRNDGTCELPPPVCTTDSDCSGAEDICAGGLGCVSQYKIQVTPFAPGSSPYLGVIEYDSSEFFLVGTGDISSGSYFLHEIVTFDADVGAVVHVELDESQRPLSAYIEGEEYEVLTYVYDASGNLVSIVEADGGNGRALETVPGSTSALRHGSRRLIGGVIAWAIRIWFLSRLPCEATYPQIVDIRRLFVALFAKDSTTHTCQMRPQHLGVDYKSPTVVSVTVTPGDGSRQVQVEVALARTRVEIW